MFVVYILYSESLKSFYVGETIDLEDRVYQHKTGFYETSYTSKTKDWELYFSIQCESRVQARKIESHIKKMKSKKYIQDLKKYPEIVHKLKIKYN